MGSRGLEPLAFWVGCAQHDDRAEARQFVETAANTLQEPSALVTPESRREGPGLITQTKPATPAEGARALRGRADGRALHPCYLFQVKAPAASNGPWDYYTLLHTTPADQAFRPLNEGGCALVHT